MTIITTYKKVFKHLNLKFMKLISIFGMLFLAVFAMSCSQPSSNESANQPATRVEPVRIMQLEYQKIARSVEYTATLQAFEEIHLAPATPGRIEKILKDIGSHVNKGDLLVQMDPTQLHQAEVQLRTLQADFKRFDTLQKVGSIAQQQYDQLKSQLEILQANVDFLRENTKLQAPFSGVISGRYFEPGEMFSGAPNTMEGKAAIVSLVQINRLRASVPVSERYFPSVKMGMEAAVSSDTYPGREFIGRVLRIHPRVDPASRTFNVEIVIENRDTALLPGMFIRASFDIDEFEALLIPAIAVLKLQGSNDRYLFIAENGRARRIPVLVGKRYDDNVEVISEKLKRGDHVIISGQARLLDGVAIEVIQ